MEAELIYVSATDAELTSLLEGRLEGGYHHNLNMIGHSSRIQSGQFGVVAALDHNGNRLAQPLAVFVAEPDQRRLFGRLASLRPELSPLSSWCHVIGARFMEAIDGNEKRPDYSGTQAAWCGLAVIEASILAERAIEKLSISACLATQSYGLARALGLWPQVSIEEVLDRYDRLHLTIRGSAGQAPRLRPFLEPVWAVLYALMGNLKVSSSRNIEGVVQATQAILQARRFGHLEEHFSLARALRHVPEAEIFDHLDALSPEERVKAFDHIVSLLRNVKPGERYNELSFLAAYLATVAAGGKASIGLADKLSREFPQLIAWAYLIGGIGQTVTWSSAFDGLGRLVARDLNRPFRLDDGPLCDFSLEEAAILQDRQLSDPLVYLKIKQPRSVTVALMPGVNIAVPLADSPDTNRNAHQQIRQTETRRDSQSGDVLSALAEAIFPYIEERLKSPKSSTSDYQSKANRARASQNRGGGQRKLPLEK